MKEKRANLLIKKILSEKQKRIVLFLMHPIRNKIILLNIGSWAKKNRVNINYWNESKNLGDLISPLVINYVLRKNGKTGEEVIEKTKHLYGIGSVLTAGLQDCTVWGSGVLNSKITDRLRRRRLDIRAVRGPLTKAVLEDYGYVVPAVYGDPALLMSDIYRPNKSKRVAKYGVIMHKDYEFANNKMPHDSIEIDIKTDNYEKFIDQINSVDIVISSSLHGIILAEAYGKKAILFQPQKDFFKYYDYYYGTGRLVFPVINSFEELKNVVPAEAPDLERIKKRLYESFPLDLYEKK